MSKGPFVGIAPGGGGLQLSVLGFPTRIQASFVIVVALLGWFPGATLATVTIWVAVASASIMWHELGHAFAARRLGAKPSIDLYGFGGLTRWQPPADPSRLEMIGVSLAGPAAGIVLGGLVAAGVVAAGDIGSGNVRFFVLIVLWINLGWGLVNLLPVLPLDGGHVMVELLPGTREQRQRRATILSVVIGGVVAVGLIAIDYFWGALIFGWAVATNITSLGERSRAEKHHARQQEGMEVLARIGRREEAVLEDAVAMTSRLRPQELGFRVAAIETAASVGDAATARAVLEVPGPVPPALYALVMVVESGGLDGLDELEAIFRREPSVLHARLLTIAFHRAGRMPDLIAVIERATPEPGPEAVRAAADVAAALGHVDVAVGLRRSSP